MSTTTSAHPNIALIKYWGKQPRQGNVPASPSLSITLDTLTSTTTVTEARTDAVELNGQRVEDAKINRCIADFRAQYAIPPVAIRTSNNFPTAAGLASSASGFAALVTALDAEFDLDMTPARRSEYARQASGSAARSIYGGFVTLSEPDWIAKPLLKPESWPLRVVVAITDQRRKPVSSSEGMRLSAASPFYEGWVTSTQTDYEHALGAVGQHDFEALAKLAEASCLKMHGLMLGTPPGLIYWNQATLACIEEVRRLRQEEVPVFFTIDAGPQVKAVCTESAAPRVQAMLSEIPGVQQTQVVGLGEGARVVEIPE